MSSPTDNTILANTAGTIVLADSPATVLLPTDQRGLQITIGPGDAVGGTATVQLRPAGSTDFDPALKDQYGATVTWTMSAGSMTYIVPQGRFSAAKITLSGTGAGKKVKYAFVGA